MAVYVLYIDTLITSLLFVLKQTVIFSLGLSHQDLEERIEADPSIVVSWK